MAARIATDAARSYLGSFANHPDTKHALADPLCMVEAMKTKSDLPPVFIAAGLDDPVAETTDIDVALPVRLGQP